VVVLSSRKEDSRPVNVTQSINIQGGDLIGGKRSANDIVCSGCSGPLSDRDLRFTDLGVMVKCPYCGKAYVLEEEPKW
jgi:hypothetical protein